MNGDPTAGSQRRWRRAASLVVAIALLAGLYAATDWKAVLATVGNLHFGLLLAALAMFIPQTLASGMRWRAIVRPIRRISLADAVRHTLASSALNLVVPSKLGDLSKAAMVRVSTPHERRRLAGIAVVEKLFDVIALSVWMLAGWLGVDAITVLSAITALWLGYLLLAAGQWVIPARSASDGHELLARDRSLARPASFGVPTGRSWIIAYAALVPYSATLWCLHLAQIHLLLEAAGVSVSVGEVYARVSVAIFAGLAPLSLFGMGTRDAALVWMFADIAPAPTMAAVGLLTALRYLVPGAVGIPFLARALGKVQTQSQTSQHRAMHRFTLNEPPGAKNLPAMLSPAP